MFDWITRLCGEGKIRIQFETECGEKGYATIPYIGDINTMDRAKIGEDLRLTLLIEHRKRLKSWEIVGIQET